LKGVREEQNRVPETSECPNIDPLINIVPAVQVYHFWSSEVGCCKALDPILLVCAISLVPDWTLPVADRTKVAQAQLTIRTNENVFKFQISVGNWRLLLM